MSGPRTVDEILDELLSSHNSLAWVEEHFDQWVEKFRDAVDFERENGGPRPRWER